MVADKFSSASFCALELAVSVFDTSGHLLFEFGELGGDSRIFAGHDLSRENTGVGCACLANCHGGYRNAGRHLHRGEQRVKPLEDGRVDRNTDNGQSGICSDGPREMSRGARASDNNFQPTLLRSRGVLARFPRRAVGGHDAGLVGNSKVVETFLRLPHHFQIRIAAHQNADSWLRRYILRRLWFLPSNSSYGPASNVLAIVHPVPSNLAHGGISIFYGIANVSSSSSDAEHAASGGNPVTVLFRSARVKDKALVPMP